MKKLFFILSILLSFSASADSVKTIVGKFSGVLNVEASRLDIKEISIQVTNQFCNLWGTTCAGGPNEVESIPVKIEESSDGKMYKISSEDSFKVSTRRPTNRFSSCKVSLVIEAVNFEGKLVRGIEHLAFENNKDICEQEAALTQKVQGSLDRNLKVEDGGVFVRIK